MASTIPGHAQKNPLPPGEAEEVIELLEERWGDQLTDADDLRLDAVQVDARLFVTLLLNNAERQEALSLEVQLVAGDFPDLESARHLAYDALDSLLGSYLEAERQQFFPVDWTASTYNGAQLAYRGVFRRPELERAAEALLAQPKPGAH